MRYIVWRILLKSTERLANEAYQKQWAEIFIECGKIQTSLYKISANLKDRGVWK